METLRDRAIEYRMQEVRERRSKLHRDAFRSNELWTADEARDYCRERLAIVEREVATLRAMPADVSDDEVRRAMGVQ